MSIGKEFSLLEIVIGYKFKDGKLLETALTHSSYANEQKNLGMNFSSNERLEFLGDAVLQIVISEYLYENFKNRSEGALTKMRQFLVCEKTLHKIGAEIKIGDYIHLGKGEESTDCRMRPKVIADTVEALLGAVYLDSAASSSEEYRKVILDLFDGQIKNASEMQRGDYKTILQQLIEKDGSAVLEYAVTHESGPEHDKVFTVVAKVNNNIVGSGKAKNKKEAEMQAAKTALALFGVSI